MKKRYCKIVRLKHVTLVVVDDPPSSEVIEDAYAVIEVDAELVSFQEALRGIRINGREVHGLEEIPNMLENTTVELLGSMVRLIIYYPDKEEVCIATVDEYAYYECVEVHKLIALFLSRYYFS